MNALNSHRRPRRQFIGQLGKLGFTAGLLGLPPDTQPVLAGPPPQPMCADGPPGAEFIHWSATKLAKAIREKTLSSEEVVRAYICRIEAVNRKINAVVQLAADRALAEAREADAALARGELKGPLHGVPMTIKDLFETENITTTFGETSHRNYVPSRDATAVARLRAAGAILLGKTNVGNTPFWEANNPVFGRTNNPFDLARSPGASGSGGGAIVAVSGAAFDLGSDLGGSVRFPAGFCGLAGLKPTTLRVSNAGHYPHSPANPALLTPGPVARFVEDLELLLPVIAGLDERDPAVLEKPLRDSASVELKKLRVAFHIDNGLTTADSEVASVVRAVASLLAEQGLPVEEARPAVISQAASVLAAVVFANPPESALKRWTDSTASLLTFMEKYDVIISPMWRTPPAVHGSAASDLPAQNFLYPYSLTGWPVAVVRCGTSRNGLPIGVQIASRPWREDIALAVAQFLETALGGWAPVPPAQITHSRAASGMTLRWKGYGTLQSAESIHGPWSDVPNDRSPQTVPLNSAAHFYRVRQ